MALLHFLKLWSTSYFVGLAVICGLILSFVYPHLLKDDRYPVEYKIGKYVGYFYIGGGLVLLLISTLFS
ncbi:hypothetical protein QBE55_11275 [Eubacteriales bacterium mix99]|jgi:hypothetical protein|nr:hypothetical protein [Clostridiales bacterium]